MKTLVFDTTYNEGKRFQEESEFKIMEEEDSHTCAENHSNPDALLFLNEKYIDTLELIQLNNHPKGIRKVIGDQYDEIIKFLKEQRLIIFIGKNWMDNFSEDCYEISRRGDLILTRYELK